MRSIDEILNVLDGLPFSEAAEQLGRFDSNERTAALLRRKPTTGIAGCCARVASGHAAAAPPRSDMNSRRVIRSPRRRE